MSASAVRIVRDPVTGNQTLGFRNDGLPTEDYLPAGQADRRYATASGLGTPRFAPRSGRFGPKGLPITHPDVQRAFQRAWHDLHGMAPRGLGAPAGELPMLPPTGGAAVPGTLPTIPPGGRPQQFIDQGTYGGCPPRGKGIGWFGFYARRNVTDTSAAEISTRPQNPVRVTQIVVGGSNPWNWQVSNFRANQQILKHGGLAPATIFKHDARYPIPFDLLMATSDELTADLQQIVAPGEPATSWVQLGGQYCFTSTCYTSAYPCSGPILKEGTRQIILGLGAAAATVVAENGGATATMVDAPNNDTLLGNLILEAVYSDTPDEAPEAGLTPNNGVRALAAVGVVQIDLEDTLIYTTNRNGNAVAATSDIPGLAFAAESASVFFPDVIADSSQNIHVLMRNRTDPHAVNTGGFTNDISVLGAMVGCLLACDAR